MLQFVFVSHIVTVDAFHNHVSLCTLSHQTNSPHCQQNACRVSHEDSPLINLDGLVWVSLWGSEGAALNITWLREGCVITPSPNTSPSHLLYHPTHLPPTCSITQHISLPLASSPNTSPSHLPHHPTHLPPTCFITQHISFPLAPSPNTSPSHLLHHPTHLPPTCSITQHISLLLASSSNTSPSYLPIATLLNVSGCLHKIVFLEQNKNTNNCLCSFEKNPY